VLVASGIVLLLVLVASASARASAISGSHWKGPHLVWKP